MHRNVNMRSWLRKYFLILHNFREMKDDGKLRHLEKKLYRWRISEMQQPRGILIPLRNVWKKVCSLAENKK